MKIYGTKWKGIAIVGTLSVIAIGLFVGCSTVQNQTIAAQDDKKKQGTSTQKPVKAVPKATNKPKKQIPDKLGTVGKRTDPAYAGIVSLIEQYEYQGNVLLIRNGQPVWQQGFGEMGEGKPFDPDAPIPLTSITKNVTAYLLMKELTRQGISLDQSLADFYPELAGANQTTLRDLIRMDAPYTGVGYSNEVLSEQEYTSYYLDNMMYKPTANAKWRYNAADYQILTALLAKLTNKPYDKLVKKELSPKYQVLTVSEFEKEANRPIAINNAGKPKKFNAQRFNREVGTGNLFMSAWNAYRLISDEIQGQSLTSAEFADMTQPRETSPYGYSGGMYKREFGYQLHGILQSFEPSMILDTTGKNGVVMFSNEATGNIDKKLAKPIFDIWMTMN